MTTPIDPAIQGMAEFFAKSYRTPILRRPDEYGLEYEDVFFPSMDGVALEGWFIPAPSNKLIICNHFMPGNRYGYPGHLDPWKNFGGFEVNFLPQYKALHDAGYNVLAYDLRNHGRSGTGNGGLVGIGLLEYRDVIGSLRYAKSRPDTQDMTTGLLSVCLGANSTIVAMDKHPEEFAHIKAMVALQPVSARPFVEQGAAAAKVADGPEQFDQAVFKLTGFHMDELSPIPYAHAVTVPTLMAQVHDDFLTKPSDVQTIFDKMSAKDKKLHWIQNETQRFQGYNYFGQHPELMLEWFGSHLGG
jgi:pimeloyl-ACP methyl ester carboxylesterase